MRKSRLSAVITLLIIIMMVASTVSVSAAESAQITDETSAAASSENISSDEASSNNTASGEAAEAENIVSEPVEESEEEIASSEASEDSAEADEQTQAAEVESSGIKTSAEITSQKASAKYKASYGKAIVKAIEAVKTDANGRSITVDVSEYGINKSNVKKIVTDILNSNPQLFIIEKSYKSYLVSGTNNISRLSFTLKKSASTTKKMLASVKKEVARIDKHVNTSSMKDEEIALAVHDYIAANTVYDKKLSGDHIYDMYGALVERKAVCQGYALAYQYVMQHYGIKTALVTSTRACHAWNIVKINGKWYHVDVTWDDPINGSLSTDEAGYAEHNYFLLSTSTLLKKSRSDAKRKDFEIRKISTESYSSMNSKKFESGFWKKSKSAAWYYKGYWYYSGKNKFEIIRYNYKTKSSKKLVSGKSVKWKVVGKSKSYYKGSYSYLGEDNGNLYYSTPDRVYKYNISSGSKKTVAKNTSSSGKIYGLKVKDGKAYYTVKKTPHGKRIGSVRNCK